MPRKRLGALIDQHEGEIRRMFGQGATYEQMMKRWGISFNGVYTLRLRLGLIGRQVDLQDPMKAAQRRAGWSTKAVGARIAARQK